MTRTRERGPSATSTPATRTYNAPRVNGQATGNHRHEQGPDVDDTGWSTCPGCGYLTHPTIATLDGARARRRLVRAS